MGIPLGLPRRDVWIADKVHNSFQMTMCVGLVYESQS
jgi:hypothetical protein